MVLVLGFYTMFFYFRVSSFSQVFPLRLQYFLTLCVHHHEHRVYLIFNKITYLYKKKCYLLLQDNCIFIFQVLVVYQAISILIFGSKVIFVIRKLRFPTSIRIMIQFFYISKLYFFWRLFRDDFDKGKASFDFWFSVDSSQQQVLTPSGFSRLVLTPSKPRC